MPIDQRKYFLFSPFFVDAQAMSDLEWNSLQDKIDKLPQHVINLMTSDKTSGLIDKITTENNLNEVQGQNIARIIRNVFLGKIPVTGLAASISANLHLNAETAKKIESILVSEVFNKAKGQPGGTDIPPTSSQKISEMQKSTSIQGEDLPETGGNIIDLRNK